MTSRAAAPQATRGPGRGSQGADGRLRPRRPSRAAPARPGGRPSADRPASGGDRRRRKTPTACRSSTPAAAPRQGRKDFSSATARRLRRLRDPLPGRRRDSGVRPTPAARLRLHADRRGRNVVHLPPQDRREPGPQPAAVGRDARQDLHQPDHELERPGDQGTTTADWPSRPCRSSRSCAATGPAPRPSSPRSWTRSTRASGQPASAKAGRPRTAVRQHVDLPRVIGQAASDQVMITGIAGYVSPAERGHDRVRRVLLPDQQGLPGRQGPQQGRLLRRADAVQRRGRADQGEDQPGQELAAVPDADPRRRLPAHRPAGVPDLVLQLHDHPDRVDRPADDDGEATDDRRLPLLLAVRGADQGRPVRLLAAPAQPGAGGFRADRQARRRPTRPSTSPTATSRAATTRPSTARTWRRTSSPRSHRCRPPATSSARVPAASTPATTSPRPTTEPRRSRSGDDTPRRAPRVLQSATRAGGGAPGGRPGHRGGRHQRQHRRRVPVGRLRGADRARVVPLGGHRDVRLGRGGAPAGAGPRARSG